MMMMPRICTCGLTLVLLSMSVTIGTSSTISTKDWTTAGYLSTEQGQIGNDTSWSGIPYTGTTDATGTTSDFTANSTGISDGITTGITYDTNTTGISQDFTTFTPTTGISYNFTTDTTGTSYNFTVDTTDLSYNFTTETPTTGTSYNFTTDTPGIDNFTTDSTGTSQSFTAVPTGTSQSFTAVPTGTSQSFTTIPTGIAETSTVSSVPDLTTLSPDFTSSAGVTTATWSDYPTDNLTSTTPKPEAGGTSPLDAGEIALIVICSCIAAFIIGASIFLVIRHKRRHDQYEHFDLQSRDSY